jgi:hypothetical protein
MPSELENNSRPIPGLLSQLFNVENDADAIDCGLNSLGLLLASRIPLLLVVLNLLLCVCPGDSGDLL